jgi:hypothetical protein
VRGLGVEPQAIGVFEDEPAACPQRRRQLAYHGRGFSQMLQDQPGMDQIELACGRILALQVMTGEDDAGTAQARQAVDVDVGGQDRTTVGYLAGKQAPPPPGQDSAGLRPTTRSD